MYNIIIVINIVIAKIETESKLMKKQKVDCPKLL